MDIPKKPGTYWFKTKDGNWKTAIIGRFAVHMCYASWETDQFAETFHGGTFGPIVPGPDELAAMENVVGIARAIYGAEVMGMSEYDELTEEFKKLDALRKDDK